MLSNAAIIASLLTAASAHQNFHQFWVNDVSPGLQTSIRMPPSNNPVTDLTSNDLACNANGSVVPSGVTTTAASEGDTIKVKWDSSTHPGPISHFLYGPVDDASMATGVGSWIKIDEFSSKNGTWANEIMMTQDMTYSFKLPTGLASGEYLLRSEMLALHACQTVGGAQFYIGCAQLKITGTGSAGSCTPKIQIPGAYKPDDANILIPNIHNGFDVSTYKAPGGEVAACGGSGYAMDPAPVTPSSAAPVANSTAPDVPVARAAAPVEKNNAPAYPVAIPPGRSADSDTNNPKSQADNSTAAGLASPILSPNSTTPSKPGKACKAKTPPRPASTKKSSCKAKTPAGAAGAAKVGNMKAGGSGPTPTTLAKATRGAAAYIADATNASSGKTDSSGKSGSSSGSGGSSSSSGKTDSSGKSGSSSGSGESGSSGGKTDSSGKSGSSSGSGGSSSSSGKTDSSGKSGSSSGSGGSSSSSGKTDSSGKSGSSSGSGGSSSSSGKTDSSGKSGSSSGSGESASSSGKTDSAGKSGSSSVSGESASSSGKTDSSRNSGASSSSGDTGGSPGKAGSSSASGDTTASSGGTSTPPTGTTLDTLLSWLASFYTVNKGTNYNAGTAA